MVLGVTGPPLRATGYDWDLRKTQPYCGYETYDFDVVTWDTADAYGRFRVRLQEMWESLKIVEQCYERLETHARASRSWSRTRRSPGRRSCRSAPDGQGNSNEHIKHIMGESMEALIHHFKIVTEGFKVPVGPGLRGHRVARRASSAATWSPTAAPGPTGSTCATQASTTCSPFPPCARAA